MTEEPWNKHNPGDPLPCECEESVVEVRFRNGTNRTNSAWSWPWGKDKDRPDTEINAWRFVKRKGNDVIATGN